MTKFLEDYTLGQEVQEKLLGYVLTVETFDAQRSYSLVDVRHTNSWLFKRWNLTQTCQTWYAYEACCCLIHFLVHLISISMYTGGR